MKIIDAHVHVKGGDTYRRELPVERTLYHMDRANIGQSIVFSICLPSRSSNILTREAIRGHEDRLIPFAHIIPAEGQVALRELDRAVDEDGFRGVKLHCGEAVGEPDLNAFMAVVGAAAAKGVPVLLDCNERPQFAEAIASGVPEAKLIFPHLGSSADQRMNWRFFDVAGRYDNVWLDTSYTSGPWMIPEAYHALGARKLIWGSDGGGDYYPAEIELAKITVWEFPEPDLQEMLCGNISRLLARGVDEK
jgi:predicted TIM-barrel fold metal-dependent hydrolase